MYQKAYAEFFCSPEMLEKLERELSDNKHVSIMSVSSGGERTPRGSDAGLMSNSPVTAVTWGVFPGQEIQQPTVVDANSFMAWKDEAFALWDQFAEVIPEDNKAARELVSDIQNNWYLVNAVDNNFLSGDLFASLADISGTQARAKTQRGA